MKSFHVDGHLNFCQDRKNNFRMHLRTLGQIWYQRKANELRNTDLPVVNFSVRDVTMVTALKVDISEFPFKIYFLFEIRV